MSQFEADFDRKLSLLKQLKITFESLIFHGWTQTNTWSNLNGLMMIFTKNIYSILQDGLIVGDEASRSYSIDMNHQEPSKFVNPNQIESKLWEFVTNLKQQSDECEAKIEFLKIEKKLMEDKRLKITDWILNSLKFCNLNTQLQYLLNENDLKDKYFKITSILNDDQLTQAFFCFIRAFEQRDREILNKICLDRQMLLSSKQPLRSNLDLPINHRRIHSEPLVEFNYTEISEDLKTPVNTYKESNDQEPYGSLTLPEYIHALRIHYNDRSLIDMENSHFMIADLTIAAVELAKSTSINLPNEPQSYSYLNENLLRTTLPKNSIKSSQSNSLSGSFDMSISPNHIQVLTIKRVENELDDHSQAISDDFDKTISLQASSQMDKSYSWELTSKDYDNNAEYLSQEILSRTLNLTASIINLNNFKYIIENNDFSEFTRKYVEFTMSKSDEQRIVGDELWAPVREQLIFTLSTINLKSQTQKRNLIKAQHMRCADCGQYLHSLDQLETFRYCEYFCKFFCACCHIKSQSYIPAQIIYNLDFSKTFSVSKKAKHFLDKVLKEPVISLEDLNPELFEQNSSLFSKIKRLRLKLYNAKSYINTCRLAIELKTILSNEYPDFLVNDYKVYSFHLLFLIKKNTNFLKRLKFNVLQVVQHVYSCELCSQQAYICELCEKKELLYPFDIDLVEKCPNCLTCYHNKCFKTQEDCLKCKRKKSRNEILFK